MLGCASIQVQKANRSPGLLGILALALLAIPAPGYASQTPHQWHNTRQSATGDFSSSASRGTDSARPLRAGKNDNRRATRAESRQRGRLQPSWNRLHRRKRLRPRSRSLPARAEAGSQLYKDSQQPGQSICRSAEVRPRRKRVHESPEPGSRESRCKLQPGSASAREGRATRGDSTLSARSSSDRRNSIQFSARLSSGRKNYRGTERQPANFRPRTSRMCSCTSHSACCSPPRSSTNPRNWNLSRQTPCSRKHSRFSITSGRPISEDTNTQKPISPSTAL